MPTAQLVGVLLLLVGVLIAGVLIWSAFKRLGRAAYLLETPLSPAGKLEAGVRKVRGRVVPLEATLLSPISQLECIFFDLRVLETYRTERVKGSPIEHRAGTVKFGGAQVMNDGIVRDVHTQLALHARKHVPFAVEDESGRIRVDATDCEMTSTTTNTAQTGTRNVMNFEIRKRFQDEFDFSVRGETGDKELMHVESLIKLGDEVTVIGNVTETSIGLMFAKGANPLIVTNQLDHSAARTYRIQAILMILIAFGVLAGLGYVATHFLKPAVPVPPPQPPGKAAGPKGKN